MEKKELKVNLHLKLNVYKEDGALVTPEQEQQPCGTIQPLQKLDKISLSLHSFKSPVDENSAGYQSMQPSNIIHEVKTRLTFSINKDYYAVFVKNEDLFDLFKAYFRENFENEEVSLFLDQQDTLVLDVSETLDENLVSELVRNFIEDNITTRVYKLPEHIYTILADVNLLTIDARRSNGLHISFQPENIMCYGTLKHIGIYSAEKEFSTLHDLVFVMCNFTNQISIKLDYFQNPRLLITDREINTLRINFTGDYFEHFIISYFIDILKCMFDSTDDEETLEVEINERFHPSCCLLLNELTDLIDILKDKTLNYTFAIDVDSNHNAHSVTFCAKKAEIDGILRVTHAFLTDVTITKEITYSKEYMTLEFYEGFIEETYGEYLKEHFPRYSFEIYNSNVDVGLKTLCYHYVKNSTDPTYDELNVVDSESMELEPGLFYLIEREEFWLNEVRKGDFLYKYDKYNKRINFKGTILRNAFLKSYCTRFQTDYIRTTALHLSTTPRERADFEILRTNQMLIRNKLDQENKRYHLDFIDRNVVLRVVMKENENIESFINIFNKEVARLIKIPVIKIVRVPEYVTDFDAITFEELKAWKVGTIKHDIFALLFKSQSCINELKEHLTEEFSHCFIDLRIIDGVIYALIRYGDNIETLSAFSNRIFESGETLDLNPLSLQNEVNSYFDNNIESVFINLSPDIPEDIYTEIVSYYIKEYLKLPDDIDVFYNNFKLTFKTHSSREILDEYMSQLEDEEMLVYRYVKPIGDTEIDGDTKNELKLKVLNGIVKSENQHWKALISGNLIQFHGLVDDNALYFQGARVFVELARAYLDHLFSNIIYLKIRNDLINSVAYENTLMFLNKNGAEKKTDEYRYLAIATYLGDKQNDANLFEEVRVVKCVEKPIENFLILKEEYYKDHLPNPCKFNKVQNSGDLMIEVNCLNFCLFSVIYDFIESDLECISITVGSPQEFEVLQRYPIDNIQNMIVYFENQTLHIAGLSADVIAKKEEITEFFSRNPVQIN